MARNLIGGLVHSGRGSVSGVLIVKPEEVTTMAKAKENGVYTLNGNRFTIRKGDNLPEGAVMDGAEAEPEVEERAQEKAPENKAKQAAPENRNAKTKAE